MSSEIFIVLNVCAVIILHTFHTILSQPCWHLSSSVVSFYSHAFPFLFSFSFWGDPRQAVSSSLCSQKSVSTAHFPILPLPLLRASLGPGGSDTDVLSGDKQLPVSHSQFDQLWVLIWLSLTAERVFSDHCLWHKHKHLEGNLAACPFGKTSLIVSCIGSVIFLDIVSSPGLQCQACIHSHGVDPNPIRKLFIILFFVHASIVVMGIFCKVVQPGTDRLCSWMWYTPTAYIAPLVTH